MCHADRNLSLGVSLRVGFSLYLLFRFASQKDAATTPNANPKNKAFNLQIYAKFGSFKAYNLETKSFITKSFAILTLYFHLKNVILQQISEDD